ncbi:unnamed protein product [Linum tenue]|uniref:EF-hand domain-containing protein n=1 Tax=Linum tenue TaxID=586396 RepID=A0AAV0PF16_9ROSI|nr:unnamed protein product [Linum tenue]
MEDSSSSSASTARLKSSCSSSFRLRSPSLNSLRLRRIFDMFDKNGDEIITVHDLSQALTLLGLDADFSELESTIQAHIKSGNDGLEFEDFVSLHQSLDDALFGGGGQQLQQQDHDQSAHEISQAFKVFDEDGDGYISAHELQVVLRKLGLPEATEIDRVEQMIFSVDRNQDGQVDFFEFKDMMRSVLISTS